MILKKFISFMNRHFGDEWQEKNKKSFKKNYSNIQEELHLFDKSIYNSIFPLKIRQRGERYFDYSKIKNYNEDGNKYSCVVSGTDDYEVSITFQDNSDKIVHMSCTCPYFEDKNSNCKHIYALLYKIKCSNNKAILIREIEDYLKKTKIVIHNFDNFIENNKNTLSNYKVELYNSFVHKYDSRIIYIEKIVNHLNYEDILANNLENIIKIYSYLYSLIYNIMSKENNDDSDAEFLSENNIVNEIESNGSEYSDEELDEYGLEDWQKELVKRGEYDPWNFEEEELDEEDYYSEDDL